MNVNLTELRESATGSVPVKFLFFAGFTPGADVCCHILLTEGMNVGFINSRLLTDVHITSVCMFNKFRLF